MLAQVYGLVRGKTANQQAANANGIAAINARGDLSVAQGLPHKAELSRMGATYHASIPTGSAFTTVAAWPTTRAELVLSNPNPAGSGICFVIDSAWCATIVTETAASQITILAQLSSASLVATAANNTAVLVQPLNGKAATAGQTATLAVANTAFAVASRWQVMGVSGLGGATVSVGQACLAPFDGLYIVQPQATLCLNAVVGTAVAAAGLIGVTWSETYLDLGA